MKDFDLRKYLAENKLYKDDVWYIEASEDSADIEQAGPKYKEAVINIIKAKHPDITDKDLEESIEVMNVTWYNEARSNAKGSEPEEMEVSAEDFADGAMEHYEDVIVWNNNNLAEGLLFEEETTFDDKLEIELSKFSNPFNEKQERAFMAYVDGRLRRNNLWQDIPKSILAFSKLKDITKPDDLVYLRGRFDPKNTIYLSNNNWDDARANILRKKVFNAYMGNY